MTPWLDDGDLRLYHGDALEVLRGLPDESVDCVVTSPPYWGLRDYGVPGQIGLEPTPDEFVAGMVDVFREVRRVLADHGTCWVNLGDSYEASTRGAGGNGKQHTNAGSVIDDRSWTVPDGLKPKDLVGIPWRVAFALQQDGWWLRSDIVWAKPNPMPESVTDRPTKAHEYVFLLTKQPRYWFDAEAVREPMTTPAEWAARYSKPYETYDDRAQAGVGGQPGNVNNVGIHARRGDPIAGRNVRTVWTIPTQPYPEAHFATFPEELARRAILAGCPLRVCRVCGRPSERIVERESVSRPDLPRDHPEWRPARYDDGKAGDPQAPGPGQRFSNVTSLGWSDCGHNNWRPGVVLDPFMGSGTTAKVARDHQRHAIGIELNEQYLELAARRLQQLSLLTGDAA